MFLEPPTLQRRAGKVYECKTCKKKFSSSMYIMYVKHLRMHTNTADNPLFRCTECNKIFTDSPLLKAHMLTEHNLEMQRGPQSSYLGHRVRTQDMKFLCRICDTALDSVRAAHDHYHEEQENTKCNLCDFLWPNNYDAHLRSAHGMVRCSRCPEFVLRSLMDVHKKTHLKKQTRAKKVTKRQQNNRPKTKDNKSGTIKRKREQNQADAKKVGEQAEKKPVRRRTVRKKKPDYRHEGSSYICARCDQSYSDLSLLRAHIKTEHRKKRRHVCPYCKKEFTTPASLTVHKLEEHNQDDRLKCKACNAAFNSKARLRDHTNIYHMLGKKYKCEECEYESFSCGAMYKHKFKHKTVKDYHCRFCRKSFLRKTTLNFHERIHTGDKRKACSECGKTFVQKASLNYHMTKYHPEVHF